MEIELGNNKTIRSLSEQPTRFTALIWGAPGCGKTTLAATAPGRKLWINFDPDGLTSITGFASQHSGRPTALSNDVLSLDLSAEPSRVVDGFKRDDHLKLGAILGNPEYAIDTVVVDSLTRVSQLAIEAAIASGQHGKATIERPGQSVYGARNAVTYRVITDILGVTGRYNKNCIFITHEDAPVTNEDGVMQYITMALGGKLPILSSAQISEVWLMTDTGKERRLAVRPCRGYKPMKTRMFDASKSPEFVWKYDINDPNPDMEIATWFEKWRAGNGVKLPLPA